MSRRLRRGEVLAVVRHWQPRLMLDAWDIRLIVTASIPDLADCEARPEYLEAVIRVNPVRTPADQLEAVVVHELCHCHTWELWEAAEDGARGSADLLRAVERAHERLTSTLQRVVMASG